MSDEFHPVQDEAYSSDPPTVTGYREYAAKRARDHKAEPEAGRAVGFQFFVASEGQFHKSALSHYVELYLAEQKLRDHTSGQTYLAQMKAFIADVRDKQLPRVHEAADRKAVIRHIKGEYGEWGYERKELHARQRAKFSRNVELASEKRLAHPENTHNRETAEFFARKEVVQRYGSQHEELNVALAREITQTIDRAIERQIERNRVNVRAESAPLDEIVRRAPEPVQTHARDSGTRDRGPDRGL
jgi:hypothetical protein